MSRRALAVLLIASALPAAAHAQSLFSTRGLGTPIEGIDARARGIGVSGVGLAGLSTTLLNPAESGGTLRRGVSATFQPWGASAELSGQKGNVSGTRFPLISVLYPVSRITFTFGFSGVLDQSWAITADTIQHVGADSALSHDIIRSIGGIGELKVGAAYLVAHNLSLGAQIGVHSGTLERTSTREFPDSTLLAFQTRERWDYTGPLASVGMRWDPIPQARVGASLTWSGTLEARAKEGTTTSYKYDMPLRFAAGASGRVNDRLLLAFSTTITNFSPGNYTAPGTAALTTAQRSSEIGGGLEWQELRSGSRIFPLRAGFHISKLPFHNAGEAAPTEKALSAGLGLRLVEDEYGPLAVADIGFERGTRDGWTSSTLNSGLTEKFWRFSVTMSLFGR
jgi:hypothetical protein